MPLPLHSGKPWSPYFVFLKGTEMTDEEVLRALGLAGYVPIDAVEKRDLLRYKYIAIGRDSRWTHVADNFGYTHWHSKAFKDSVSKLGCKLEVFTFSVGDIDVSFDLHHYRDGSLVRCFVWEANLDSGGQMKEQFGLPLEGEDKITCGKDPIEGLWQVASALEIETDYTGINLRLYAPVLPKHEDLKRR